MAHNLTVIKSAYTEAQTITDKALGYSNVYAMPIAFRAIDTASEQLGPDASTVDVVDAAFHGHLWGSVRQVLRQRGQM
jgi:hypothetical protein